MIKIYKYCVVAIAMMFTAGCLQEFDGNNAPKLTAFKIENESNLIAFKSTNVKIYAQDQDNESVTIDLSSENGFSCIRLDENTFQYRIGSGKKSDVLVIKLKDQRGKETIEKRSVTIFENTGPDIVKIATDNADKLEIKAGKKLKITLSLIDKETDKIASIKMASFDKATITTTAVFGVFVYEAKPTTTEDTITVTSTDEFGDIKSTSFKIKVIPNQGPTVNTISINGKYELKATEGKLSVVKLTFVDEEQDITSEASIKSLSNLAVITPIAGKTGEFNYTSNKGITKDEIEITVKDVVGSISTTRQTITISPNTAPVLQSVVIKGNLGLTAPKGKPINVKISASDNEGDKITFDLKSKNSDSTVSRVDGTDNEFIYTAGTASQTDEFTITLTDDAGKESTEIKTVTLQDNQPPNMLSLTLNGNNTLDVLRGEATVIKIDVADPDGDVVKTVTVVSGSGSTITKKATSGYEYDYIPAADITTDKITITMTDDGGKSSKEERLLSIKTEVVKEITYILYMGADNDLNGEKYYSPANDYARSDIVEMINAQIDSTKVNFVMFSDFQFDGYLSKGIYIKDGSKMKLVQTVQDEPNTGDGATLKNFINYVADNYKAKKYILGTWGHGTGWWDDVKGKTNNPARSLSTDWTVEGDPTKDLLGDGLDMWEFTQAIKDSKIKKFDIIYFDMCLMGMAEIAYQIREVANYTYVSPELTPGLGGDYKGLLEAVSQNYNKSSEEIGKAMIDINFKSFQLNGSQAAGDPWAVTYALYDLSKAVDFVKLINEVAKELNTKDGRGILYSLQEQVIGKEVELLTYGGADYNEVTSYVDIGDLMRKLQLKVTGTLKVKVDALVAYLDNRTEFIRYVKSQNGLDRGSVQKVDTTAGVSIYFDFTQEGITEISNDMKSAVTEYEDATEFGRYSEWTKLLKAYFDVQI